MDKVNRRQGNLESKNTQADLITPISTISDSKMSQQPRSEQFHSIISILLYSTCSVSLILLNKSLVYSYQSNYTFFSLFCQNGAGLVLILLAKKFGFVSFPEFDFSVVKKWSILTLFFVIMLETSLLSLRKVSVPVFTVIKNIATVLICIGEKVFFHKPLSSGIILCFFIMITGSILAAFDDSFLTIEGLVWSTGNVLSTVVHLLYLKHLLQAKSLQNLGRFGPVFYSNLMSIPVCIVMMFLLNEHSNISSAIMFQSFNGQLLFMLNILVGSVMSFSTTYCLKSNSATTYSVCGSLNKIPATFLGAVIFNQYPSFTSFIGISIGLIGGILYSYFQSQPSSNSAPPKLSK